MLTQTPTITQLSEVISQVTAPAFLLAAEAELLAVLVARLDRAVDRSRMLSALSEAENGHAKLELPLLARRAALIHRAIYWCVASAVVTSVLVIVGFVTALLHVRHEYGAAVLFMLAMALLTAGLVSFALEVRVASREIKGLRPVRS